jgi:hypothetical protein
MDFSRFWFANSGANPIPFPIDNSLRFRGSQYLSRNPSGTGSTFAGQRYTVSMWVKYALVSSEAGLFNATQSGEFYNSYYIQPNGAGFFSVKNSGMRPFFEGTEPFRDPSAWYHIVVVQDTPNSTSSLRDRFFVNNRELTQFPTWKNESSQNQSLPWFGSTVTHYVGSHYHSQSPFKGYIAEFHACDGYVYSPSDFGEYNDDGVWLPKNVSGVTYGTNGFYLDFSDPGNIGADRSGNGNNYTPSGFELSNSASRQYDWMKDSPTNNYPTINPLYNYESPMGLFEANLKVDTNSGTNIQAFTTGVREGKYYAEIYCDVCNSVPFKLGIIDIQGRRPSHFEQNTYTLMFQGDSGTYNISSGSFNQVTSSSQSWNNGTLIGLALDADNSICYLYKNGTLINTVNFSSYVSPGSTYLTMWHGYAAGSGAAVAYLNAGQRPFAQSVPSGYKSLASAECPDVEVTKTSEHFNVLTYTGNGQSTNTVTGLDFQPDFVWIKNRTNGNNHMLQDSVRGANVSSNSNTNGGESTNSGNGHVDSFNSNGFTAGWDGSNNGGDTNANGQPYVAWCWKRSVTSGFDVVTWTGNNTKGRVISHNLGVQPGFIMLLHRTGPAYDHYVWHQGLNNALGSDTWIRLNSSGTQETGSGNGPFSGSNNITQVTSSGFTVANEGNNSSATYVAYVWAPIPGLSAFGTYTGNSNSNGPFIYTGFRPALVIAKVFSGGNDYWFMWDKARDPYNVTYKALSANTTNSEQTDKTNCAVDLLSNGFKVRTAGTNINGNGSRFLYMAFAEHPFGGGNAAPSPAR